MNALSSAAIAALFAVACSSVACSSSGSGSIPDPTPGTSETSPTNPNNPSDPADPGTSGDPSKPNVPAKPADPKPDPATKADCDALASAFCQRLTACGHLVSKLLGSVATCAERFSHDCVAGAAAPGSGMTHAAITTCLPAIATTTCSGLTNDKGPAPCSFKGTLADAKQCAFDHQCTSGSCSAIDGQCGYCEPVASIGGACAGATTCASGAYCNVSTGKCAARTPLGQACGAGSADHCVVRSTCMNGVCTAFGNVNQACDKNGISAPACDLSQGYGCIGAPTTCQQFPIATSLGAACGFSQTSLTLCGPGLVCATDATGSGTCVAETPEGGACAPGAGGSSSTCALGLECISGTCGVTTAAVCK